MNIQKFQQDLQKGMGVEETCKKHKVSLEYAFKVIHKWQINKNKKNRRRNKKAEYPTIETNIQRNHGYMVRKSINGKQEYYGRYPTLETARTVRDYLEENGWNKENLRKITERIK